MAKLSWLSDWRKGGPGSGPHPGNGTVTPTKPVGKPHDSANNIQKPSGYSERPSSRNPGARRFGVRPQDLYAENYNPDGSRKPKKHWLSSWRKVGKA